MEGRVQFNPSGRKRYRFGDGDAFALKVMCEFGEHTHRSHTPNQKGMREILASP